MTPVACWGWREGAAGGVVGFSAWSGLGPASRSGRRPRAKDATTAITRRRNSTPIAPVRVGLLWGLALLGLLLLPSDYQAGAETAHGHALMHLWLDAADGVMHHHDPGANGAAWDWLDPALAGAHETGPTDAGASHPDVGEHQDSAPAGGGVHMLVGAVAFFVLGAARAAPSGGVRRALVGQGVPVLLPPPRWSPTAN